MTVFEIALNVATLILLLPVSVLFAQVLLAVTRRGTEATEQGNRPRLTVVMPAHDEATLISITVLSVMPQLLKSDRFLVVADNCTDQTAALAAAAGAEVIVRTDSVHRGKGYALDYAVRHLESDPPAVVIVIDADCQIATGTLDQLARCCARTERPVQSLNLMHAGPDAAPKMRIAEFAWLVKNFVRPIGMHRLGLPCQLMGTGMAFHGRASVRQNWQPAISSRISNSGSLLLALESRRSFAPRHLSGVYFRLRARVSGNNGRVGSTVTSVSF